MFVYFNYTPAANETITVVRSQITLSLVFDNHFVCYFFLYLKAFFLPNTPVLEDAFTVTYDFREN